MMAWATPRGLLIRVAGIAGLSLVVFALLPSPLPNARSVNTREPAWTLPVPIRVDSDLAVSTINQRRLWGAGNVGGLPPALPGAAPDEKPLTPPDWRITGVFTESGKYAVLVSTDGQFVPQTLHVGDALPGGAKIIAINSDRLILTLAGRRVSLSTYPQ
jgi:hypothetical protein